MVTVATRDCVDTVLHSWKQPERQIQAYRDTEGRVVFQLRRTDGSFVLVEDVVSPVLLHHLQDPTIKKLFAETYCQIHRLGSHTKIYLNIRVRGGMYSSHRISHDKSTFSPHLYEHFQRVVDRKIYAGIRQIQGCFRNPMTGQHEECDVIFLDRTEEQVGYVDFDYLWPKQQELSSGEQRKRREMQAQREWLQENTTDLEDQLAEWNYTNMVVCTPLDCKYMNLPNRKKSHCVVFFRNPICSEEKESSRSSIDVKKREEKGVTEEEYSLASGSSSGRSLLEVGVAALSSDYKSYRETTRHFEWNELHFLNGYRAFQELLGLWDEPAYADEESAYQLYEAMKPYDKWLSEGEYARLQEYGPGWKRAAPSFMLGYEEWEEPVPRFRNSLKDLL